MGARSREPAFALFPFALAFYILLSILVAQALPGHGRALLHPSDEPFKHQALNEKDGSQ